MSLQIRNEQTCRLASGLARLSGETMTGAAAVAFREWLEREHRGRGAERRIRKNARHRGSLCKTAGSGTVHSLEWRCCT